MAAVAALLASLASLAFPAAAGRPVTVLVERALAAPLSAARRGLLHFHWARGGAWPPRILPLAPASSLSSSPSSPSSPYPAAASSSPPRLPPAAVRGVLPPLLAARGARRARRTPRLLLLLLPLLPTLHLSPSPPPPPSFLDEPPLVYTRLTRLHCPSGVRAAVRAWLSFTFRRGGGLPLPPPLPLPRGARLVVPPFLLERLLAVDEERGLLSYAVANPGLLTYQVHSHRGEVRFAAAPGGAVQMAWRVEVRPYRGWEPAVRRFTAAVIDALATNLQAHLEAPGATVRLPPPLAAWEVERASWAGGVAEAWREDRRPLARRAAELWRPWRWGRRDAPGEAGEWTRSEGKT